jgi:hypothetical protein
MPENLLLLRPSWLKVDGMVYVESAEVRRIREACQVLLIIPQTIHDARTIHLLPGRSDVRPVPRYLSKINVSG